MSEEKRLDIMGFISEKLYNDYNEYCMNREMVIKKQNQCFRYCFTECKNWGELFPIDQD